MARMSAKIFTSSLLFYILLISQTLQTRANFTTPTPSVEVPDHYLESQLSDGLIATYRMTTFFLDSIIQTRYLTSMEDKILMESWKDITGSASEHWQDWVVYLIGFVVCAALGLVLFITVLLAAFIFPCCRCCGRCGAGPYGKKGGVNKGGPSRGCRICLYVSLGVVLFGLFLGMLPLFFLNVSLNEQVQGQVFTDINQGLEGTEKFLNQSVEEVNTTVYGDYLVTEAEIFRILDNMVEGVMEAIDNETQLLTTIDDLDTFAQSLDTLQNDLMGSSALAISVQDQVINLNDNLTAFQADIAAGLTCLSTTCNDVMFQISNTTVQLNFTSVILDLEYATSMVNVTIESGFVELVAATVAEIDRVENEINATTYPEIANMKAQSEAAKTDFQSFITKLDEYVGSLGTDGLHDTVNNIAEDDMYQMIVEIVYWSVTALCAVIAVIVGLSAIGLLLGLLLRPGRAGDSCCAPSRVHGTRFLMAGVGLTLVFYWLYALIVVLFFVAGGVTHTEVCRHVNHINRQDSFQVLCIFDRWINETLKNDLFPFNTYRECSSNASLYRALNAESFWNVRDMSEEIINDIGKSVEEMKATDITVPTINVTDPNLMRLLEVLDSVFGVPNGTVNFDEMQSSISGPVTLPDISVLIAELGTLNTGVDYTGTSAEIYINQLEVMDQSFVQPISTDRDELYRQLEQEKRIVTSISFAEVAVNLESGQAELNANGSEIVSQFVNDTADSIYNLTVQFADTTVTNVEDVLAKCHPLYESLSTIFDTACVKTLYPFNGFWFSLGWCLAFFIAFIFLAVNVAKIFAQVSTGPGPAMYGGRNRVGHMDEQLPEGKTASDNKAAPARSNTATSSGFKRRKLKPIFGNSRVSPR